jgi:phosphomethylpyrimidine synthase
MNIEFGNKAYSKTLMLGQGLPVRFLANVGHMNTIDSLDNEKRKVDIAYKNEIDIIADNSITHYEYEFRKWIKDNYPLMLNTVPIYECFDRMKNNTFVIEQLYDVIQKHIDCGSDMIVVHPGLTRTLCEKINRSDRLIKVTSRGGSQIYRYINKYHLENPYYENWDSICKLFMNTGVSMAIGFSLRSASIINDLDELYLEEMDIVGELVKRAQKYNIPIIVEGVGHVKLTSLPKLMNEINIRCGQVPIKTLGPLLSDRMLGYEHINALLGGMQAALNGASIIGALFRSEHLSLPTQEDFEESLINYKILKYILNMNATDINYEEKISRYRNERNWTEIINNSFNPMEASKMFCSRHNEKDKKTCSMCGDRCALIDL